MRRGVLLDLLLVISEGLFRAVKFNGSTDSSDHKTVEFRTLRGGRGTKYKIISMDLQALDTLLARSQSIRPWDGKGVQENWLLSPLVIKITFQTEEKSVPTSKNSGKNVRRPTWMNKELQEKLRHKKRSLQRVKTETGNWGVWWIDLSWI